MENKFEFIKLNKDENIATILLNRPEKKNAINIGMIRELGEAVTNCENDNTTEIVIFQSEIKNPPIFSSGIDIKNLSQLIMSTNEQDLPDLVKEIQNKYSKIANSKLPTIAIIDGLCLGAALELAIACDFRVVSPRSKLTLNETRFGIIPDLGGITRLVRLTNQQVAKRLIMVAESISSQEALELGLIDWIDDDPNQKAMEIVSQIQQNSTMAVQLAKQRINESMDMTTAQSLVEDGIIQLKLIKSGEPMKLLQKFFEQK